MFARTSIFHPKANFPDSKRPRKEIETKLKVVGSEVTHSQVKLTA